MSRNLITAICLIIVLLFHPATSMAQQQARGEQLTLTVEQAVALGMENSNALHASAMKVEAADARESEVKSSRYPSLKLNGTYTRLSEVPPFAITIPFGPSPQSFTLTPPLNNYSMRLTVQQPLFTGFRLQNAADAAEYSTRAVEQDYVKDKTDLAFNIKTAYWNLFKAEEFKKVIDENVGQVKAHLTDVTNLMNQGMATNNDVLRVQVQLSNAQLMQIDANNNVRMAMLALNNVMGIPLSTEIRIGSAPRRGSDTVQTVDPELAPLSDYSKRAAENRPELKGTEFRVKAGEEAVSAARGNWWPQLFLVGNYNYARPNSRIVPTQDKFKDTWDLSVTASWDLWNWGATASQTTQAQAQLAQARDAYEQVQDGVTLEVNQSYLAVQQAAERIGVSATAVRQAQENHRVTSEKFKMGLALNTDLIDAEVALLQARTNYTQSLVDYELAQARLAKTAGETL